MAGAGPTSLRPAAVILALAVVMAFVVPALDRAVPAGRPVVPGEVLALNGGVGFFTPTTGWDVVDGVTLGDPTRSGGYPSTAFVVVDAVSFSVTTAKFAGTPQQLLTQIEDLQERTGAGRGPQVKRRPTVGAHGDRSGRLVTETRSATTTGLIAAFVLDGTGVEVVVSGPRDAGTGRAADVTAMIESIAPWEGTGDRLLSGPGHRGEPGRTVDADRPRRRPPAGGPGVGVGRSRALLPAAQRRLLGVRGPGRVRPVRDLALRRERVRGLRHPDHRGRRAARPLRGVVLVVHPAHRPLRPPAPQLSRSRSFGAGSGPHHGLVREHTGAVPARQGLRPLLGQRLGSRYRRAVDEELAKGLGLLLLIALATRAVSTAFDGFILGAFIGLGFQIVEDVTYAIGSAGSGFGADPTTNTLEVIALRMATGLGAHIAYSAIFCTGLVHLLGRPGQPRRVGAGLGLMLTAMLLHSVWDNTAGILGPASSFALVAWAVLTAITLVIVVRVFRRVVGVERAYMRAVLAPEVKTGTITAEEAETLAGDRKTRKAYRQVAQDRDPRRLPDGRARPC